MTDQLTAILKDAKSDDDVAARIQAWERRFGDTGRGGERLFGTWYCGIHCAGFSCDPLRGTVVLRRSIDPDGYERIHRRLTYPDGDSFLSEWKVERKWGASVSNSPPEKGKLVASSCNAKTAAGYSTLSVNLKNPNGSDRHLYSYWVDEANQTLWIESYDVRWEGDKMHKKIYDRRECRREIKDYR